MLFTLFHTLGRVCVLWTWHGTEIRTHHTTGNKYFLPPFYHVGFNTNVPECYCWSLLWVVTHLLIGVPAAFSCMWQTWYHTETWSGALHFNWSLVMLYYFLLHPVTSLYNVFEVLLTNVLSAHFIKWNTTMYHVTVFHRI
jgi:hypothetical protein